MTPAAAAALARARAGSGSRPGDAGIRRRPSCPGDEQGELGEPWPGAERSAAAPAAPAPGDGAGTALRHPIQTSVPGPWIPFLPAVIDPSRRDIMLERGVLLRSASEGRRRRSRRAGSCSLAGEPYRPEEEELPRDGRKVLHVPHRSRWIDGSTLVWLSRHTAPGAGEERSGLQFDIVAPPP